ncbi:hypothetical protein [Brachybacterium hainanense]|uniref:Uncharacterized protein n=1 Tax=Brachybacterium hainanense TaxID=1541174 RepID=A0ABV6RE79_9MICO
MNDARPDASARGAADAFAHRLTETLTAFVGNPVPVESQELGSKLSIRPEHGPVRLSIGDVALLSLDILYRCRWNEQEKYLSTVESWVKVFPGPGTRGEPLFRYEYDRETVPGLPSAHLQIHAHRDSFTHIMALAGAAGAKRRSPDPRGGTDAARLSNIHFPLGGDRFRPCLEDVLQMLKAEFDVATGPTWEATLRRRRLDYRLTQLRATVDDHPETAALEIERLGFHVTRPDPPISPRIDRISAF